MNLFNRRIAKTAMMLCAHMFLAIIVWPYISRFVLDVLGFEGYGNYGVVG